MVVADTLALRLRRARGKRCILTGLIIGVISAGALAINPSLGVWTGCGSYGTFIISAIGTHLAIPLTTAFLGAGIALLQLGKESPRGE